MEVNDYGYRFVTIHNEFGDTAQVRLSRWLGPGSIAISPDR